MGECVKANAHMVYGGCASDIIEEKETNKVE